MNLVEKQLESIVHLLSDGITSKQSPDLGLEFDEKLRDWSCGVERRICRYYFRGEPSCDYNILPKIARADNNLLGKEKLIRKEMLRAFPDEFRSGSASLIEQLIVMQHYGVPTRLLDVTRNFLVALYFACQPIPNSQNLNPNGRVLVFNVSTLDPIVSIKEKQFRELECNNPFVAHIMDETFDEGDQVPLRDAPVILCRSSNEIAEWCKPFILRSAYLSQRQRIQSGHFLMFPNKYVGGKFSKDICTEPTPSSKLIIKSESKVKILEWLDLFFGINNKNLFPEDIDGACRDILGRIKSGLVI